jgi:hypothetical protein
MSEQGNHAPPQNAPLAPPKPRAVPMQLPFILAVAFLLVFATLIGSHWPGLIGDSQSPAADTPLASSPAAQTAPAPREGAAPPAAAPPASATISIADLVVRLGGVEARLATVENGLARAGDRDVQSALQSRLARLEAESSGEALRRAGLVLALATLARAASETGPFKPQLDAMAALAPGDPAVMALSPYAEMGAPSIAALAARFADEAREALDAERIAAAGDGVFGRLWSSLTGLIRVRRIGEADGTTSADKLARAEGHLARRDLANAVAETRGLEGAARTNLAGWLRGAQARLAIDNAIAAMETRIVTALALPRANP